MPEQEIRVICLQDGVGTVFDWDLFISVGTEVGLPSGSAAMRCHWDYLPCMRLDMPSSGLRSGTLRPYDCNHCKRPPRGSSQKNQMESRASFKEKLSTAFIAAHYSSVLEWDNITRHEWPICDELGMPKRTNYLDFQPTRKAAESAPAEISLR